MHHKISIIIPTLNAEAHLGSCLNSLRAITGNQEVLIVDGGSVDDTLNIAQNHGVCAYRAPKGRGSQMNYGAEFAQGDILLFLHADSTVSSQALKALEDYYSIPENLIGTYRMKFDTDHWLLRFYGMMAQYDSLWTSFGDQGISVRREFYRKIGGFPDWKLFEDVEFLRRARKQAKIGILNAYVTTSSRRFVEKGLLKQQAFNAWLIFQYLIGASSERLSRDYYD